MSTLIDVILPVFIVIGFGYLAVWRGYFTQNAADTLMRFAQNFAIPVLLFTAISTLDLSAGFNTGLLLSYYSGSTVVFFLGLFGARFLFGRSWQDSVAIGFCALFANSLLLGISLTERAFGVQSLGPNFAIVAIHAPFCYFLGITAMEIVGARRGGVVLTVLSIGKAMFQNTLMIAIILGFIVNLGGVSLPLALTEAFDLIIRAALPTALFALGAVLYHYRPEGSQKEVIWVCLLSLIVHPTIVFGLSTQVFDLPTPMVRSAVLTAAMAPGVNAFLFANLYGRAKRVAATAVLAGTAGSIITASLWLAILQTL